MNREEIEFVDKSALAILTGLVSNGDLSPGATKRMTETAYKVAQQLLETRRETLGEQQAFAAEVSPKGIVDSIASRVSDLIDVVETELGSKTIVEEIDLGGAIKKAKKDLVKKVDKPKTKAKPKAEKKAKAKKLTGAAAAAAAKKAAKATAAASPA